MSFLLMKRKIFLLFFLLFASSLFAIQANATSNVTNLPDALDVARSVDPDSGVSLEKALPTAPKFGAPIGTQNGIMKNEAAAVLGKQKPETPIDGPGDWVMRLIEGLTAAAIPFAALYLLVPLGLIFAVSGLVLGISSYGLEMALDVGVSQLSTMARDDSVRNAWQIFRNLANVGLIFTLVFIALKTVLRSSGYEGKKLLGSVIIAGLLMNFSFLFGAIVVDVSNEMALVLYDKVGEVTEQNSTGGAKIGSFMTEKASPSIFQSAVAGSVDKNTSEIVSKTSGKNISADPNWLETVALWPTRLAMGYLLGSIANLVLAVVMFIAVCMIYSRIIVILFLLVVSPFAFASMVLPNTKKMSTDWWNGLIGHAFFLPVFLLFLLVAMNLVNSLPETESLNFTDDTSLLTLSGYAVLFTPFIFRYLMIIGLFIAALMAAKKVSDGGGTAVGKISASVTSAVGGAAAGGLAFAGRNSVGRTAEAMSKTQWAERMGSSGRIGSFALDKMKGVAKSGFDARESRAFKGVASATGLGGDFNKTFAPTKDGFTGQEKRAVDKRVARAGNLRDELTKDEESEMKRLEKEIVDSVKKDPQIMAIDNAQKVSQIALKEATKKRDVLEMEKIQKGIESNKKLIETREEEIKGTEAYKKVTEQFAKIETPKNRYASNLNKPLVPGLSNNAARWIPFNGRSVDQSAAKKIQKGETDFDKLLKKINTEKDKAS